MNLQEQTLSLLKEFVDEDFNDDIVQITVYKICMDTYSGKRLYLAQTNPAVKRWQDAKTYEWQFNPAGAMEFDTKEEAEEVAKKYFKNFDKWYIYETVGYI